MSFLYSGSLWSSLYCGISSLCVGLYRWLVKVSWLGKLVSVFWWVELYFFSLFSRTPFEELGCFSGCLMSSAGIQKWFCGIYLAFKCSFVEFVGEKVFSPSYSSAILPPPPDAFIWAEWRQLIRKPCYASKLPEMVFFFLIPYFKTASWPHCRYTELKYLRLEPGMYL